MCKVSRVYHNVLLEKQLKNQMVKCGNEGCKRQLNEGCKRQLFQWSKDEHQSECPHTKTPCPCCGEEITMRISTLKLDAKYYGLNMVEKKEIVVQQDYKVISE